MADLIDFMGATEAQLDTEAAALAGAQADNADRRRPGRSALSAELIPLLRDGAEFDMVQDDAAPMRGIAMGVLLSAPIYVAIAFGVRWAFY